MPGTEAHILTPFRPFNGVTGKGAGHQTDTCPERHAPPFGSLQLPPVYPHSSFTIYELSLQSSFQRSLTVLVLYRSRASI